MTSSSLASSKYAHGGPAVDDSDDNDDNVSHTGFSLRGSDFSLKGIGPSLTPVIDQTVNVPEDEELQDSKFEVILKLADLQGDPNSPLYSIKKFEQLGL